MGTRSVATRSKEITQNRPAQKDRAKLPGEARNMRLQRSTIGDQRSTPSCRLQLYRFVHSTAARGLPFHAEEEIFHEVRGEVANLCFILKLKSGWSVIENSETNNRKCHKDTGRI